MFQSTTATQKISNLTKKIRIVQGGTSASKTISILLYLIARAQSDKVKTLTSVIAESTPHLKRGAMRDFKNILQEHKYWKDDLWNATDSIYTFETGSQIEFFSADQSEKLRGARRDRCFMNEANNMSLDAFDQLEVRTKEFMFIDYNPTNEFWALTDVKGKRDDVDFIILTYKDNEALSPEIISSIESRKNRKGWWDVYGLGQLGEVEGKIYKDWEILDEFPHQARLERRGIDFGYTNDPTAIVDIYYYNGGYILDEVCYQKGMSNKQIADTIKNLPEVLCIADSAEPKSIDEIKSYGVNIQPAVKGAGSVNQGIQFIQAQRISMTKRSVNLIKEYRNYLWATDKNGKILNIPEGGLDHCFAPISLVCTTKGDVPISKLVGKEGYVYSRDGSIQRFYNVRETKKNAETVKVTFNDGLMIEVTPDHLLLKPNGQWIEAGLLNPMDLIQSGTYGTKIQWKDIQALFRRKVLQSWKKETAQGSVGVSQRRDSKRNAHTSQGWELPEQLKRKLGIKGSSQSSIRTYNTRKEVRDESMGRKDKTSNKEVAWVKRGVGVAQVTWKEDVSTKRSYLKRMLSLPQDLYYKAICKISKVLSPELQNESKTKTAVRIERGLCPVMYNMEVESTHCLLVDGVIAHNCLDSCRYALSSFQPSMPDKYLEFKVMQNRQTKRTFE